MWQIVSQLQEWVAIRRLMSMPSFCQWGTRQGRSRCTLLNCLIFCIDWLTYSWCSRAERCKETKLTRHQHLSATPWRIRWHFYAATWEGPRKRLFLTELYLTVIVNESPPLLDLTFAWNNPRFHWWWLGLRNISNTSLEAMEQRTSQGPSSVPTW